VDCRAFGGYKEFCRPRRPVPSQCSVGAPRAPRCVAGPTPADQALADAAWAKENLARAKQTLPNGYCGLPLQQTCPHPNACLTCDHFLTSDEFLPLHREQLDRTRKLLADARERGQQRLVEINEPVELNLVRIIDGLQSLGDEDAANAA
jgi:hypothetical protein